MLIDQVFLYFLIAVGIVISLPALWLLMRARWPRRVAKLRTVADRSVLLSFLAGIPVIAVILAVIVGTIQLAKRGDVAALVTLGLLASVLVVSTLAGLAGLVALIGERLASGPSATDPWKSTLRGGIVIACLVSMPYLGWFALLPVCMITGGGMMLRSFFVGTPHPLLVPVPPMTTATPPAMPTQVPAQTA